MRWMMTGLAFIALAAGGARAANDGVASPAIPAVLGPYLTAGKVAPGDYRWMRGRFPDATPGEIQTFIAAADFDRMCKETYRDVMRTTLAAMGLNMAEEAQNVTRPVACRQFTGVSAPAGTSWLTFSAAVEKVRPYALGLLRATQLAEDQVLGHGDFAEQLRTRTIGEQMLRFAWVESQRHQGATAGYTPLERSVHEAILLRALEDTDIANTQWLAGKIAAEGWPSRPKVGDAASDAAWLLAQHADADPAFQVLALRLMTPLVPSGAVNTRNFALLTDRLQLKLTGKQLYGTQWQCKDGKRTPLPLKNDAPTTDRLRATAKLESLAKNAEQIDSLYGPCTPSR
jgi:hypothetical protein